ncbi:MAG: hypothetical protein MUE72_09750 [Chitinophagaceae bacterium]|nr:hypothetical protein [Chitinophagaceae bacterium]
MEIDEKIQEQVKNISNKKSNSYQSNYFSKYPTNYPQNSHSNTNIFTTNSYLNNTKSIKKPNITANDRKKVVAEIADLFLLGNAINNVTPKEALDKVNMIVHAKDFPKYTNAFKNYFINYWYPGAFTYQNISKEVAIECVFSFLELHKNIWVANKLTEIKDEYKKELKLLREI